MTISYVLISLTVMFVPPERTDNATKTNVQSESPAKQTDDTKTVRSPKQLRKEYHALLRQEATAKDLAVRGEALLGLVGLAEELRTHPTMAQSAVDSLRATIRSRLRRSSQKLKQASKRLAKNDKKKRLPKIEKDNKKHAAHLAQFQPPVGAPGQQGLGGNGGNRANDDYGDELAELIQNVIAPDSWEVNGGNGTIVYFAPLRVLVVRQRGEVHNNLGGLFRQMRRAQ